jgi:hypothetical protein
MQWEIPCDLRAHQRASKNSDELPANFISIKSALSSSVPRLLPEMWLCIEAFQSARLCMNNNNLCIF